MGVIKSSQPSAKGVNGAGLNLTGGRLLARNTAYNLLGQLLPMSVAFVSLPFIIKGLGTERFGVLSLVWVVVGYFSLFDLGIGRATKKYVAEYIGRGDIEGLPKLVWTSIAMLALFGAVAGILLAAFNTLLVTRVLNLPESLRPETHKALYLLAISIPITLGSDGARGVLEAQQRFGLVNTIKIPASILSFLTPLIILPFSKSLYPITAALLANRIVVFSIFLYLCIANMPNMGRMRFPEAVYMRKLLSFGGWITISNLVGPLMTYCDRFMVASVLTMSAVAYYSTPYDLVAKLGILPMSLIGVVFPAMSATFEMNPQRFSLLYERSSKYIMVALSPVTLLIVLFADPFLRFWLGSVFALRSTLVLQLLAVGLLVNSIAVVPYAAIQAMDRPDLTAKIHLLELPLYLSMMWFLIHRLGIVGVALSWLLRVSFDMVFLYWLSNKMVLKRVHLRDNKVFPFLCVTGELLITTWLISPAAGFVVRCAVFAVCMAVLAVIYACFLFKKDERSAILSFLQGGLKKPSLTIHSKRSSVPNPMDR